MPFDLKNFEQEEAFWKPTGELRWYRPKHGHDTDRVLEVLWQRFTGERQWRPIPVILED